MEWMLMPLRRYAEFSGRSRRKEYWMYTLGLVLLYFVMFVVMIALGGSALMSGASDPTAMTAVIMSLGAFGIVFGLVYLALLIPTLAVTIRRLHDTDRTGWWVAAPIGVVVVMAIVGDSSSALNLILSLVYAAVGIALLVFMFLDGTKGPNRYGEDPKGSGNAEVFA